MKNIEDNLFELFIIQLQLLRSKTALMCLYNYYGYTFSTDLSKFDAVKFVEISTIIVENENNLFDKVDCDKLLNHFLEFEKTINYSDESGNYKLSRACNEKDISLHDILFGDINEIKKKIMKSIINYCEYEIHNKLLDVTAFYGKGIEYKDGEYRWK